MHYHLRDFPNVFSNAITQTISLKNVPLHDTEMLFLLWKQTPRWEINFTLQLRGSTATVQTGSTTCFYHSSLAPRVHKNWFQVAPTSSVIVNVFQEIQEGQQNNIKPTLSFSVSSNGLNGTISVYPLEGSMAGMMPTPASANSPTAYTILDVDQNAYLFVGGILGTVKVCVFSLSVCSNIKKPVCLFLIFLLLLSFRKQMPCEHQRSQAAWERPSWMVNLLDYGTTERDRETVKDVLSGIQTWCVVGLFSVCPSCSCEFISRSFFKFDRFVHLDPGLNGLEFGGQRSLQAHKTHFWP